MVLTKLVIDKFNQFVVECEQSQIKPTAVFISDIYLEILKKKFPNLFEGESFVTSRFGEIPIVLTKDEYIGMGLVFGEFNIEDHGKKFRC